MGWLLILAIVLPLAQQPTEPPKDKRPAETNRAESTARAKKTDNNQTLSAQATPASTQAPIATESQRNAATADNHAETNGQQASDEDRTTQGKLAWFTGVLAAVGVLQLVVMFLTWLIYRRQANEMRRQRHEMRRQRHVMFRQWKAMGEQAKLMEGQLVAVKNSGEQTDKLITHAEGQVKALLASATAMQKSIVFQEAALEQWIDIIDWQTDYHPQSEEVKLLRIRFNVVNPTNFPLTLQNARLQIIKGAAMTTVHFGNEMFIS